MTLLMGTVTDRSTITVATKCSNKILIVLLQKLLLLPELDGNSVTGMDGASDGRLSFTNMIPTLELVNDGGHGLTSNGGAPRIKVEGLRASWTHVRKQL